MKLLSNNFLEALSASEFQNLTTEVKETLATNAGVIAHKKTPAIFTAAELWNIHRQRKTTFSRQNFRSGNF
jgi:hypothetical protein